jgi:hypothetical protein
LSPCVIGARASVVPWKVQALARDLTHITNVLRVLST